MHFEFDMYGNAINFIAKNNCLDVINWPNHLRVILSNKIYKGKVPIEFPDWVQVKEKHYNLRNSLWTALITCANFSQRSLLIDIEIKPVVSVNKEEHDCIAQSI